MATIVCQGLQSCLDNTHTVEPKKVWLKVSSPTPHFSQPLELALKSCFSDSKTKEVGQKYRIEEVCNKPCNSLNSHSSSNPDLGGWSFLQAISTDPEGPKETMDQKEKVYVHPLVKRSSSMLSEKSLQLCTENLGNETGTEINDGNLFSLPSSDHSKRRNLPTREQNKSRQLSGAKKVNTQNFPPPLTTMSGSESLRVRTHREDGRLIIEAVKAPTTQSYFQAERSHGRLVLRFVKTCTTPSIESEEADDQNEENGASNEAGNGKERFDSDAIEEKQQAEEEEEEKEEEEEDWDDEGERDVYLVGEGMDGNYIKNGEVEMRKEKFERPRRCKEDEQHGKNRLLEWEPLWVATS